jgi:hypothetical protein
MTESVYDYRMGSKEERVPFTLQYYDMFQDFQNCKDVDSRWKILLMGRHICGGGEAVEGAIVGKELHPEMVVGYGGEDCGSDEVCNAMSFLFSSTYKAE